MYNLLNVFCYLSALLILGILIKNKIKVLQELFIPASVIGGVIGLLLSSEVLGKYYDIIPLVWEGPIKSLPGTLIIPIIVSIPLGIKITKGDNTVKNFVNTSGILFLVTFFQLFLGYLINFIFDKVFNIKLYDAFGSELNSGFAGGHGTAALVGRTMQDLASNYWELAQGVTVTIASIGLIFGIVFGIYQIKIKSNIIVSQDILHEFKKGYIKDNQENFGKETMLNTTVDTLAYHFAIIFGVSGIGIASLEIFKKYNVPIISKFSIWSYGMILMFIVWQIMIKLKLDWSIDQKVRSKITGTLTEYAVISAIATIPLKGIIEYMIPIIVVTTIGIISTWIFIYKLSNRYYDDYHLERSLALFGTSTGVFITGVLLLRICDPKLKLPILKDYSLGFSTVALFGPIFIETSIRLGFRYSYLYSMALMGTFLFITIIFLEIYNRKVAIRQGV